MRRENFGKLVRALRKERFDLDGMPWTQDKLWEETGISKNIISKIERGKKANFSEEELTLLAKAFKLTTGERREFINASNGVDTKNMVSSRNSPEELLKHCRKVIDNIYAPVALIDNYLDLIGGNHALAHLFDMQDSGYQDWINHENPFNILSIFLNAQTSSHSSNFVSDSLRRLQLINIMNFRIRTLTHRHKTYFKDLYTRLQKTYPSIPSLWYESQQVQEDVFLGHPLTIANKKWGPLKVITSVMVFYSENGFLEILTYNPVDKHTANAIQEILKQTETGFVQLFDWPRKPTDI